MGILSKAPTPFKGQKFEELKKQHRANGTLFEDPEFPATNASLFYSRQSPGNIEWKRPGDLCENPHFVVAGFNSGDVHQGSLGNCWFVAATANLAQEKELWERVIPNAKDQDWDDEDKSSYAGIFHFRFWRFGEWLDVVIDDRLPTMNNKLFYTHSQEGNEFWSALLEKAYAKLSGCYENLDGGNTADALVDFTGGVAESIDLQNQTDNFLNNEEKAKELRSSMKKCAERKFLMSASIKVTSAEEMEAKTDSGLIKGHAYGITAVKTVKLADSGLMGMFNKQKIYLVRLRNPWGEKEWNGAWSDGSEEWNKVSESQRKSLGITFEDDGEFWMPYEDFLRHFTNLVVCRMPNKALVSLQRTWHENLFITEWKHDSNRIHNRAGGCINNKDTFLLNPQFLINVESEKDDIMLSLSQPDKRADKSEANKTIGFHIMEVEANRTTRAHKITTKKLASTFINSRSVFAKGTFEKGRYIVVASTFEPQVESPLMMRIFSDSGAKCKHLTEDFPTLTSFFCCKSLPRVATQVRVLSASGLERQDRTGGGADPYLYIKCEGETVRSPTRQNNLNPEWDFSVIFYRKNTSKPIVIEVWNKNVVKDTFMGQAVLLAQSTSGQPEQMSPGLKGRGRDSGEPKPGTLSIVVTSTEDMRLL